MTTTGSSASKEYQVLQKYYGKLIRAISDPVILAADLFSAGLISDLIRMKATNESDWLITRNDHLLNGMIGAIVCDPNNLTKFISILEVNTPLDSIARDMKTDYGNMKFIYSFILSKTIIKCVFNILFACIARIHMHMHTDAI